MFHFSSKRKNTVVTEQVENLNRKLDENHLSRSLNTNVEIVKKLFTDVDILIVRYFQNNHDKDLKYCIVYCDGVVNSEIINENIIKPLMLSDAAGRHPDEPLADDLIENVVFINEIKKTKEIKEIVESVTYGDTILFVEGVEEAVVLNSKGFITRSMDEPENEKILSGPREGFNESLLQNLSLVRRKVRTNELKMKFTTMGKVTRTKACICYIDKIVNKNILKELYRRLELIDIDGVLDTNYITELTRDSMWSPFRTTGYTERPDVVVGKLLEGRIAIFLDGTPVVLTVPYLFIENFQSSEDYYLSFYYTSLSRFVRILGFFLTIGVPALYVAIVAFQQQMLPTQLLISIASSRKSVPLPAAAEAFIMLAVFDILRETGIRMPSNIGQPLSIVGALVIGQAAVDASLVAAPMIIVVALTGITGLLVPKMNAPVIYTRVFLLAMATCFGLFGFVLGSSAVLIHILNLHSFGVSQLHFNGSLQFQEIKDTFIRAPWWEMLTRTKSMTNNLVRMKSSPGESNGGNHE
ncbi:spore germination protein [Caproiciproducens sp. CPB-2]|uniref:spore germination protein n=1 Tax=Caproiciproducens sp. CPB-2 TaxID=3030017 RepID=UPI0023D9F784|nr:spore germination protein [Caproiciproducens sp. CPB-2]MDF1493881.1 spore germination protein [Caproiciproducens sp. CPB-2]